MGQAAVPIVLAIAGAGASAINTSRTAKKKDAALAVGIRRQGELERRASATINETLGTIEGSSPDPIREDLASKFRKALASKQGNIAGNFNSPIDKSDAAEAKIRDALSGIGDETQMLSGLFSILDAATEQRRREGSEQGDLGLDLSVLGRHSRAERGLTDVRLSGIGRSPFLDILAAGLSGASGGMSSNNLFKSLLGSTVGSVAPAVVPSLTGTRGPKA